MKRQPIVSAAAFFVLRLLPVEISLQMGERGQNTPTATDGIFRGEVLY